MGRTPVAFVVRRARHLTPDDAALLQWANAGSARRSAWHQPALDRGAAAQPPSARCSSAICARCTGPSELHFHLQQKDTHMNMSSNRRRFNLAPGRHARGAGTVGAGLARQTDPHHRAHYPPGGFTDVTARLIGQKLQERLGQTVVIENKAGANGTIGVAELARSAPDGYSFVIVIAAHAANPSLYAKLPYDNRNDLAAVSLIGVSPLVAAANNNAPFKNAQELIAYAKPEPRQGELRLQRQRRGGAPDDRAAEVADADRHGPHPVLRARRRRCRT